VDLRHCAIDTPARPHFAPVQDELLLNWTELRHVSIISVVTETSETALDCQNLSQGDHDNKFMVK
jgi:hypothetical protein